MSPGQYRAAIPAREDHPIEFVIIIGVLGWMVWFGLAAAQRAAGLDRLAPIWFGFGAILGPIALLLLSYAPPSHCHSCGTPTRGWLSICWWCREPVSAASLGTTAASPGLPSLSSGRDWVRGRDQATPPKQIRRAASAAPISTSVPAIRRVEVEPAPAAQMEQLSGYERWLVPIRNPGPHAAIPAEGIEPAPAKARVLTTAVYVTGSTSLESGRRYLIAVHGPRLQVLGPVDMDPSAVALDRALAEMDATGTEGRLIISGPGGRSGTVLTFMSVAGTTADMVAKAIVDAARAAARA